MYGPKKSIRGLDNLGMSLRIKLMMRMKRIFENHFWEKENGIFNHFSLSPTDSSSKTPPPSPSFSFVQVDRTEVKGHFLNVRIWKINLGFGNLCLKRKWKECLRTWLRKKMGCLDPLTDPLLLSLLQSPKPHPNPPSSFEIQQANNSPRLYSPWQTQSDEARKLPT